MKVLALGALLGVAKAQLDANTQQCQASLM
jgi:hypothetical protein